MLTPVPAATLPRRTDCPAPLLMLGLSLALWLVGCAPALDPAPAPAPPSADARQAATVPASQLVAGPHGSQPGQPIDDAGNVLITEAVADRLSQAGGWVRINFRLGPYATDTPAFYAAYDQIVNRLRGRGLQVLGLMSNESWRGSQADWTRNNREHGGSDGNNPFIDGFSQAFGRLARHFAGRIGQWEIWNEPNCWSDNPSPGTFTGCSFIYPSNFAALLTACYAQVRCDHPIDVQVISGGLFGHDLGGPGTGPAGADYLGQTYDQGIAGGKFGWARLHCGGYPLDGVGQHIYLNQGGAVSTSWFAKYLDLVHGVLTRYEGAASPKPTWLTEVGWTNAGVDESVQAANLTQALTTARGKSYVRSLLWFQLDDGPGFRYGLFRSDGSAKPALGRFRAAAHYVGLRDSGAVVSKLRDTWVATGGLAQNGSPFDHGGGPYAHYWDYGYVQDFAGGAIGPCAIFDTGFRVALGFWQTYLTGSNHAALRFPLSGEYAFGAGTRQDFQGGYLTWDAARGVTVVVY